jgi:hypothetical protein
MSQSPLNQAELAKVDQMQENLIAYFRLFAGLPGITFVEEDVFWLVSPQDAPGSHVLRAHFSDDTVERRIDEVISQIGQYTDQVDWLVFPASQPADLGQHLEARGLAGGPDGSWELVGKIGGPGGTWMLANLEALPAAPAIPDDFYIEYVDNPKMLEAWIQISAEGFGGGNYQKLHQAYARHGFGPEAFSLHYIGYLAGRPVTSSTLLLAGGIASIYDVSTPIALRRQGFGSAITWATLQEAKKRGYNYAWIWSSPLGKSVYSKLGFIAADFGIREYQWHKRS